MNCAQCITPSQEQTFMIKYNEIMNDCIVHHMNLAWAAELYGKDPQVHYNTINDIHYFLMYMIQVWHQRIYDSLTNICLEDKGKKYYYDYYQIECMVRHLVCGGCKQSALIKVLDLFDLNLAYSDVNTPTGKGIGSMMIYPWPNCNYPYFEIY